MRKISLDEIKKLTDPKKARSPAVTLYLPTHKAPSPPNMSEDQLRFKNLVNKALNILDSLDSHNEFNKEFERACIGLLSDRSFWENMSDGMLFCARPGVIEYFHLPIASDEYISVSDHFHLAPVYGLVNDLQEYYLLAISLHKPLLFKGDAYGLALTDIKLPESMEEALDIDEIYQKSLQFSSVASSKGAQYHGHGAGKDTSDEQRLLFLKIIDRIIYNKTDKSLPMILAGVNGEISEYKAKSRYPKIAKKYVRGHFSERDTVRLHDQASEIIQEEIVEVSHKNAIQTYQALRSTRTSEHFAEVKDAAENGKISTLLVGMSKKTTDNVRDSLSPMRKLIFAREDESQAIDYIARQVINQSGKIINLSEDEMPNRRQMIAINRY